MSVTAQKASACTHTLMDTMCFFYTFGFTQSKTAHSTGIVSQLSERVSDSVSLESERLFTLATENMLKCLLYKTKKGFRSYALKDKWRKEFFSQRQSGYGSPCPPLRMTPFSRHIHIEFDC